MKTTKKDFTIKALSNETVKNNFTLKQIDQFIKGNTRRNFDNLTLEKNSRKLYNMIVKKAEQFKATRSQKEVKKMIISIIWERGSLQAMQTRAECQVWFKDGTYQNFDTTKTGGWGYDKESTTLAEIFNSLLRYKIVDDRRKKVTPYGIRNPKSYYLPYFEGGVGASCYYSICEYIGGKMKYIAGTKLTNTYEITFK